jgi:hypothetical protein
MYLSLDEFVATSATIDKATNTQHTNNVELESSLKNQAAT